MKMIKKTVWILRNTDIFRFKRERDRRTVIRPPPEPVDEKKAPLIHKKNKKIPLPSAVVISDIDRNNETKNGSVKLNRPESSSSTQSEEERTVTQVFSEQETRLDTAPSEITCVFNYDVFFSKQEVEIHRDYWKKEKKIKRNGRE
uniref:Uncharacterized protein n=1 Tax=Heterorhabditis bacteriophora TaxID=37862 RepID=A0A1I7XS54_HETBA